MTEKEILNKARQLIEARQFAEARNLLLPIAANPTAKRWLEKLAEIAPQSESRSTRRYNTPLVVGIIVISALLVLTLGVLLGQNLLTAREVLLVVTATELPTISITETSTLLPTETPTETYTPTVTPSETYTSVPTKTFTPTATLTSTETATLAATFTITPTFTPSQTRTPRPSPTVALGSRSNPVPQGTNYRFPGYGTVSVVSSWLPGQTGLAVVSVSFYCERPTSQKCNVLDFMLDAVGSSGTTYPQAFETGIPQPGFWDFMTADVFGGGSKTGYAGFLVNQQENDLQIRVQIMYQPHEIFFDA